MAFANKSLMQITIHKMKLLQVVGRTAVKSHFPIFYALGADESNDFMGWAMGLLRNLADENDIRPPHVYITDYSDTERHGLLRACPESDRQLCTFHIKKALLRHLKEYWVGDRCAETALQVATPKVHTVWPLDSMDTWEPEAGHHTRYKPGAFKYSMWDCYALFEAIMHTPCVIENWNLEERWL